MDGSGFLDSHQSFQVLLLLPSVCVSAGNSDGMTDGSSGPGVDFDLGLTTTLTFTSVFIELFERTCVQADI